MRRAALFLCAIILAGAAPTHRLTPIEKNAIAAVKAQLRDPDSAQFKGLRIKPDGAGCGWVNARNGYGGYTGFSVFFVGAKGEVSILPPSYSTPDLCN
jgi:hypothetical protein